MQAKKEMLFFELHKSRILVKKKSYICSYNDRTEFHRGGGGQYFTVTTPSSSPEKQTGLRQLKYVSLQRFFLYLGTVFADIIITFAFIIQFSLLVRNRGGKLAIGTRFCFLVGGWTSDLECLYNIWKSWPHVCVNINWVELPLSVEEKEM